MSGSGNRAYYAVFATLLVFTVVTVAISRVHLGASGNLVIGLLIAGFKATLVALFFMHLKHDGRLDGYLYAAAVFPLVLFAIFTFALLPDIAYRWGDAAPPVETSVPAAHAEPAGGGAHH